MANPTNAAEIAMSQAMAGINMNPMSEVMNAWRDMTTGALSPADAKVAQGYMMGLMSAGPPSDVTTTTGAGLSGGTATSAATGIGSGLVRPPGITDEDWAMLQGYATNPTGSTATAAQQAVQGGGDGTNSITGWLGKRASDAAIIVLGVVIVAVALFASSATKELVIKAGAKGLGG